MTPTLISPALTGMLLALAAMSIAVDERSPQSAPQPSSDSPLSAPTPDIQSIIIETPSDLDVLWKRLETPDFFLLTGEAYRNLLRSKSDSPVPSGPEPGVVRSIKISGRANQELAHLILTYSLTTSQPGPSWVDIGLEGLVVSRAREDLKELPARVNEGGRWEVKVDGRGEHTGVVVELLVPLKTVTDGRLLEFKIREAASTELAMEVEGPGLTSATLDDDQPIEIEPVEGGKRSRLVGRLTPRSAIRLAWSYKDGTTAPLPTLLSAQGEIALDADLAAIRTRSTWMINAVRGTTSTIEILLDPADELLDLELDQRSIPTESTRSNDRSRISIPLPTPLKPGRTVRLVMTTRRALESGQNSMRFRGFPVVEASAQSGLLAVSQSGDLWISGTPDTKLRPVDPRTELSEDLRSRPGTTLAYQFLDQPFELELRVELPRANLRVETRNSIDVDSATARVTSWLDFQANRGRIFELRFAIPRGLEFLSTGPSELVSAFQWNENAVLPDGSRELLLRVVPRNRDDNAFRIQIVAQQAVDLRKLTEVGLIRPINATTLGGWTSIRAAPEILVEAGQDSATTGLHQQSPPEPVIRDWPMPAAGFTLASQPRIWLRHEGSPSAVPLHVSRRPNGLRHSTRITARVGRAGMDIEQESTLQVDFGGMDSIDLLVPMTLGDEWSLQGVVEASRERLAQSGDGWVRWRIKLGGERSNSVQLALRLRSAFQPQLIESQPKVVDIPWIRPVAMESEVTRLTIQADQGIGLRALDGVWSSASRKLSGALETDSRNLTYTRGTGGENEDELPRVSVTALPTATLPAFLADRLWIRTEERADGNLGTTVRYLLETQLPTIVIRLPPRSTLIQASVGQKVVPEVVRETEPSTYRVAIPADIPAWSPFPFEVIYTTEAGGMSANLDPPVLVGGVIRHSSWEIVLPWSRAVLGVPSGWIDENIWHWDQYIWKRQPARDAEELSSWVGNGPKAPLVRPSERPSGPVGTHSYLFSRVGDPQPLSVPVVSRLLLLAWCSGSMLLLGLILLLFKPVDRLSALLFLIMLGFVIHAALPSMAFQLLQSSALGLLLVSLAAITQTIVERRRTFPVSRELHDIGVITPGSSQGEVLMLGSDDSTAIRPRQGTTLEHVPRTIAPAGQDPVIDLGNPNR